ncbi:hypothetical protein M413DRAFT_32285 [Hebeloma cylindrosporum]|uniref:Uncharacterized protein n=1 Tax=Hebeloma cylindrosporum TaxID=76867 RepID=A0A0C2XCV6_HEBCY|nr:hypothetical protein M413DRAFT_32285 [Hebeloma cylindrosporum h7]
MPSKKINLRLPASLTPLPESPSPFSHTPTPEAGSVFDSGSDLPDTVLPPIKGKLKRTPTPFEELEPVSVVGKPSDMGAVARRLSFGSIQPDDDIAAQPARLASPVDVLSNKRSRKPSEKAAYMAQKSHSDAKGGTAKPKPKKNIREDNSSDIEILSSPPAAAKGKAAVTNLDNQPGEGPNAVSVKTEPTTPSVVNKRKLSDRSPELESTPTQRPLPKINNPLSKKTRVEPKAPETPVCSRKPEGRVAGSDNPLSGKKSVPPSDDESIVLSDAADAAQGVDDPRLSRAYLSLPVYP